MRVGLFGGSFNPIHLGHLRAAEEDRETLGLDLVYFIPAASPPHKIEGELAPAEHRLQMARLATKGNRHFMVSDVEIRRSGRSYTIETVRFFRQTLRQPATLYLLMGGDQFAELESWKDAEDLVSLCNLAVHSRPPEGESGPLKVSLAALKHFGYSKTDDHYTHPSGMTLSFVDTTLIPISSTIIRRKVLRGQSINYLTPVDVLDYIRRHAIY
jgi:nicotinate-nucleotide adenylyltransferase